MSNSLVTFRTQAWVRDFIVAHNICPFARKELERGSIYYEIFSGGDMEKALLSLVSLCQKLSDDDGIETALFVFENGFYDFNQYLDLLDVANSLLVQQGFEGVYQLASFHPDYCFDGVPEEDASHYTNRSPYPMLHLIREQSLEKALDSHPDPAAIPARNIAYCQELGVDRIKEIFACEAGH